jgi:hypothetical protein
VGDDGVLLKDGLLPGVDPRLLFVVWVNGNSQVAEKVGACEGLDVVGGEGEKIREAHERTLQENHGTGRVADVRDEDLSI